MTIRYANYTSEGKIRKIKATDIASEYEYSEKYRNNLTCCEEGCTAKIELAHRENVPYFRTWKFSKHAPDCIFNFENDPQNKPQRSGEAVFESISKSHKLSALKHAEHKAKEDLGIISKPSRKHLTIDPNRKQATGNRVIPTVDPDAQSISGGTREAPIPSRSCDDILPTDDKQTIIVRGTVTRADINERSVHFLFGTKAGKDVKAIFFNRFRDNSQQAYGWIEKIGQHINKGTPEFIACLGLCEMSGNNISMQIMDADSIRISEKSLSAFFRDKCT